MTCELCNEAGGEVLWRGERCRVVEVDEPGYPGYCRVIWNAHVKEMTDLSEDDRLHLMEVVFAVESVLREQLDPEKINLASLGNVVPHVHWHVIPRGAHDPAPREAVWAVAHVPVAPGAEAASRIGAIRARLAQRPGHG